MGDAVLARRPPNRRVSGMETLLRPATASWMLIVARHEKPVAPDGVQKGNVVVLPFGTFRQPDAAPRRASPARSPAP